jgi:transposase InsO family protein
MKEDYTMTEKFDFEQALADLQAGKLEFYQLIDYKGDVDLAKKLRDWEAFYNFLRPHAPLNGKTPYERLREKLVA